MIEISNKKLLKEEIETSTPGFLPRYRQMLIELVNVRRNELQKLHKEKIYSGELIRNKERELDLEEARFNEL
jgi:CPA1 family monovalent cation:H+ antiporter